MPQPLSSFISSLSEISGLSEEEILDISHNAPLKYKVFQIPKKNTGKRVIAQPTAKLKQVQRALVIYLTPYLPISAQAFAYQQRKNIKHNALQHINSDYLLKMDIYDFFHSITPDLLFSKISFLTEHFDQDGKNLLTQILFWRPSKKINKGKLVLSIGAPSSPFISNIIMYQFDIALNQLCMSRGITYTRYADDMTFSARDKSLLPHFNKEVKNLLNEYFEHHFLVQDTKTILVSKKYSRRITGVTLSNDNKLTIGRKNKRILYSQIFSCIQHRLNDEEFEELKGRLAFAIYINPDIKTQIIHKYGDVIYQIGLLKR